MEWVALTILRISILGKRWWTFSISAYLFRIISRPSDESGRYERTIYRVSLLLYLGFLFSLLTRDCWNFLCWVELTLPDLNCESYSRLLNNLLLSCDLRIEIRSPGSLSWLDMFICCRYLWGMLQVNLAPIRIVWHVHISKYWFRRWVVFIWFVRYCLSRFLFCVKFTDEFLDKLLNC